MRIKRIVASIGASFEEIVGRAENHEAVAAVAIRQVQQAAAKLRGQIQTVAGRREHQLRQQEALVAQSQTWRRRAIRAGQADQARALRCLEAMKGCERDLGRFNEQVRQSDQLLSDLNGHLREIEARLHELQVRKADLSARAWRTKAASVSLGAGGDDAVASLFGRWEETVCVDEYAAAVSCSISDKLELELRAQEDREQLAAELESLLAASIGEAQ